MNPKSNSFFLFSALILFAGCHSSKVKETLVVANNIQSDSIMGIVMADTIVYDVIIKNANADDTWTEACLEQLNRKALIDTLFNMVYSQRLIAYDLDSGSSLDIKEIRKREQEEFSRDKIGKIQFAERWYFNPSSGQFQKVVISMILGYESFNNDGTFRGYKAVFKLKLPNSGLSESQNK